MASTANVPTTERQWPRVLGTLNESQARVFVAQKALEEGRGAVSRLSGLTGMSRPTIMKGISELESDRVPTAVTTGRIRSEGGGRRSLEETNPRIKRVLKRLVEASTAGDPMSYLLWTNKSTRHLVEELAGTASRCRTSRSPAASGSWAIRCKPTSRRSKGASIPIATPNFGI